MLHGNWTDKPCFYVSCRDGGRSALLVGPFAHQRQAAAVVDIVRAVGERLDPWAAFYSFGTCKVTTGHQDGGMNKHVDFERLPHMPHQWVARPKGYGFRSN